MLDLPSFPATVICGIFLVGHMLCDIVDTGSLIQRCLYIIAVGFILDEECYVFEVSLTIVKYLGQINAVAEHMTVIYQSIVVILGTALPGQDNPVIIALIAIDQVAVAVHLSRIADTQRAVGEAGIDHACIGINSFGGIQLCQSGFRHFNGHDRFTGIVRAITYSELAILFTPFGNGVGTGGICKQRQSYIALGVGQPLGQSINEGVAGQVGCLGGNAGQGGNDLVVDGVPGRSRAGVGVGIRLAGVGLGLPQRLFQGGNATLRCQR